MLYIEDYDLNNMYTIERKLLLLCGIYPNNGNMNKILYCTSAFCHLSVSLLITVSMIISLIADHKNMMSVVENVLFLATQAAFLCKLFIVLKNKRKLLEIEEILSNPIFYEHPIEKRSITISHVNSTKLFGVVYRSICCIVCLTYAIFPLIDEHKWALPLEGWNPTDIDSALKYWVVFLFQWIAYVMSAYINSGIDILIYMLITIVTSQFEILKDNLVNMNFNIPEAKGEFTKNVVLHYEILRLVKAVEDTFCYGTLIQFLGSVLTICFTEFELLILPPTDVHFISMGMYLNCMTFQVAMYCWFGHNIIASSQNINEAIYMSNWYESDSNLRKSIIIFMEKCKNPVILTAGKMFPLSLVTFTGVMRSSYSYFAVLQRLYDPK